MGRRVAVAAGRVRGANGRYLAREGPGETGREAEPEKRAADRPLTPGQCRTHLRKTLAEEFRGIVAGFVKEAKKGSCPHVKLVTELLKPDEGTRQKKGPVARLLEELKEDGGRESTGFEL